MRAVIFGGGNADSVDFYHEVLKKDDYIICADSGYDLALFSGAVPDVVIGDFDSVRGSIDGVKKEEYPKRKDMTDGQLAVEYALERDFDEIVLLGFTGCRMDHTLTNISFLDKINRAHKKGVLMDAHNEIYIVSDKIRISGKKNDLISILPVSAAAEGITTKNLEYPLDNESLYYNESRGVSNVMTDDWCEITVKIGKALVIKSRD